MRSAVAPRWRGATGRLEVWYATLSDPVTRAGLWVHCETVAPTAGAPYAHGWTTWFPPDGPPRTERFGPESVQPASGPAWFQAAGELVGPEQLSGRAQSLAWDLSWKDTAAPLWTFPRIAWERELLPGAQVVLAPTAGYLIHSDHDAQIFGVALALTAGLAGLRRLRRRSAADSAVGHDPEVAAGLPPRRG